MPAFSMPLPDERATEALGATLAARLKPGDVVGLKGDLGAGKTTLARAIIRAAAADPDLIVPSPTFTLVEVYDTPRGSYWHFDLYRLDDPQQVYELGWEEALAEGIVLLEWPERLGRLLPKHLSVTLELAGEDGRRALLDV
ncbi:MAG: tRNA (adenosine(37)-N6)-threonylcarbamoyltransferase complex ATPase subunit type 1 TsaE [Proteobacteria bacterium]|nr:tRNA (adenosine(37)-N6)-threonylcarbamoyltransferase complex ATPase subunit type 1 TsaE [Pseudomonadota bacterium]